MTAWSCDDTRAHLARGETPTSVAAVAHLDACDACATLTAGGGRLGRALAGLDESEMPQLDLSALAESVTARIADERGPVAWLRQLATPVRFGLATLVLAMVALAAVYLTPRIDLAVYPLGRMLMIVAAYVAVALVGLAWAVRPLHRAGPRRVVLAAVVLAGGLLPWVVALLPRVAALHPASVEGVGAEFLPRAGACFLFGTVLALPILAAAWGVDRGGHRGRWRGWLAAIAAGIGGNLVLQLHCPIIHLDHLIVGHATVALVLPVAYGLLLALAFRARAPSGSG